MKIRKKQYRKVTILTVDGRLDVITAPQFIEAVRAEIDAGRAHLVADLKRVDYASSAGIRALIQGVQEARRQGGDLRLSHVHANVHTLLDLAGVYTIIKAYPNVIAATASFLAAEPAPYG